MNSITGTVIRHVNASSRISKPLLKRGFRLTPIAKAEGSSSSSPEPLVKTALYDLHVESGGDMVPFAGYELPVLYKGENGGVMKEHLWCREEGKASLFDVSHMGQVSFFLFQFIENDKGFITKFDLLLIRTIY